MNQEQAAALIQRKMEEVQAAIQLEHDERSTVPKGRWPKES